MIRSDLPLPIVATPSSSDAWLARSDELLGAINHALNNRLAALGSLARVMESAGPSGDPLLTMLVQEVDRLDHTLSLLRLLSREAGAEPEPILLPDLLPQVIALHRLQGAAHDVAFDAAAAASVLPILAGRSSLIRALLLFLAEAERAASGAARRPLEVQCRGDQEEVAVVAEVPAPANSPDGRDAESAGDMETTRAIEGLLVGSGGRFVRHAGAGAGEASLQLRLPTLSAARRRERGAEGTV
jgi:signal transduction histidine kinase